MSLFGYGKPTTTPAEESRKRTQQVYADREKLINELILSFPAKALEVVRNRIKCAESKAERTATSNAYGMFKAEYGLPELPEKQPCKLPVTVINNVVDNSVKKSPSIIYTGEKPVINLRDVDYKEIFEEIQPILEKEGYTVKVYYLPPSQCWCIDVSW